MTLSDRKQQLAADNAETEAAVRTVLGQLPEWRDRIARQDPAAAAWVTRLVGVLTADMEATTQTIRLAKAQEARSVLEEASLPSIRAESPPALTVDDVAQAIATVRAVADELKAAGPVIPALEVRAQLALQLLDVVERLWSA